MFEFQLMRPDLSGRPHGFWFGWQPKDGTGRFAPRTFRWHVGAYFYAWWRYAGATWREAIPRIHFGGRGPIAS